MKVVILGGGLASLSLAFFLQEKDFIDKIDILEKDIRIGGLCQSFELNKIVYDIGPHIIFSKDSEILEFLVNLLGENIKKYKRSNKIIHNNTLLQYPFENDLSKLPKDELDYCVNTFIKNPYSQYSPNNMLQFFLKTFGEGITNLFLRPYNEKIWKFDPSFLDLQMVERIPRPYDEDILRSAKGETVDGYLHQLYFYYPKNGGIESIVKEFLLNFNSKTQVHTNQEVIKISKKGNKFLVSSLDQDYPCDKIISTIPIDILTKIYANVPSDIQNASACLKYNSLIIAGVQVKKRPATKDYVYTLANNQIIFHRVSNLDFLGNKYKVLDRTMYLVEITYRKGDRISGLTDEQLIDEITRGLQSVKLILSKQDVIDIQIRKFEYSYVLYDLNHRKNVDRVKTFFQKAGITLHGRFGEFEYLNMDTIVRRSKDLASTFSVSS